MAAYLIGHISVNDEHLWQKYVSGVQESLLPYHAKVLFRGKLAKVLAGTHDHELVVVIEFSDQTILNNWLMTVLSLTWCCHQHLNFLSIR